MRFRANAGPTVLLAAFFLFGALPASSMPIIYSGVDTGAGPLNPRPNSDAAAAAFDAAAFGAAILDFEGLPMGGFPGPIAIGGGVTATFSNSAPMSGVTVGPNWFGGSTPAILGYNTTAAGRQFLGFAPNFSGTAGLTFSFASPVNAFGAYLTGLESDIDGDVFLVYSSGALVALDVPEFVGGGSQFFGFIDPGASISAIRIETRDLGPERDVIGVDDMRFGLVPEPATLFTLGAGFLLFAAFRRRG